MQLMQSRFPQNASSSSISLISVRFAEAFSSFVLVGLTIIAISSFIALIQKSLVHMACLLWVRISKKCFSKSLLTPCSTAKASYDHRETIMFPIQGTCVAFEREGWSLSNFTIAPLNSNWGIINKGTIM